MVFVVVIVNQSLATFICVDVTTASYNGLLLHVCIYVMCLYVCCVGVSTNACMIACEILIPWF